MRSAEQVHIHPYLQIFAFGLFLLPHCPPIPSPRMPSRSRIASGGCSISVSFFTHRRVVFVATNLRLVTPVLDSHALDSPRELCPCAQWPMWMSGKLLAKACWRMSRCVFARPTFWTIGIGDSWYEAFYVPNVNAQLRGERATIGGESRRGNASGWCCWFLHPGVAAQSPQQRPRRSLVRCVLGRNSLFMVACELQPTIIITLSGEGAVYLVD